jgi:hypothetical protein
MTLLSALVRIPGYAQRLGNLTGFGQIKQPAIPNPFWFGELPSGEQIGDFVRRYIQPLREIAYEKGLVHIFSAIM